MTAEMVIDPKSIAVVTTTLYPGWYPGRSLDASDDKVRGDLALTMIGEAHKKGYQIVVVDGADNQRFKDALANLGIHLFPETEKGMSPSRQQGFKEASALEGVQAICWTEEKPSLIKNGLPQSALPVLLGNADVVVPKRNEVLFKKTYPDYQVKFEQDSNRIWNAILRKYGLRGSLDLDLDVWFGPKIFRNSPEVVSLFTDKYRFTADPDLKFHKIIRPELWPNATFFPVISALYRNFRVVSIEVPYKHSSNQTAIEKDSADYKRKRQVQQRNIILGSEFLIRYLLNLPTDTGRIKKVT